MDSHKSNGLLFLFIFILSNKTYATQYLRPHLFLIKMYGSVRGVCPIYH